MRPSPMDTTPGAAVRTVVVRLLAPPPAACGLNGCRWRTTNVPSSFSSSGDILTYVIVLVLCFLLCALALTFAVRCFLHGGADGVLARGGAGRRGGGLRDLPDGVRGRGGDPGPEELQARVPRSMHTEVAVFEDVLPDLPQQLRRPLLGGRGRHRPLL